VHLDEVFNLRATFSTGSGLRVGGGAAVAPLVVASIDTSERRTKATNELSGATHTFNEHLDWVSKERPTTMKVEVFEKDAGECGAETAAIDASYS
jgi:hypothetical protein